MKNEFRERLDRNGYAESLYNALQCCGWCGRTDRPLQRHEVFHGPYRGLSKALGCWITLCDLCHYEMHHNGETERLLKANTQLAAMEKYRWTISDFRAHFGKNYLEDGE